MKKVYIELTDEQKEKLFPIQDRLMKSNMDGKPCMVLAQILFTGRDAVAVIGTVDYDKSVKLQNLLAPKEKGKMMTDKMTQFRLKKARTSAS